jgi:hypothetical protein
MEGSGSMSIKYMTRVWDSGRWTGSELVMMLALADFANDNGYCWPSVPTLAQKCRTTERQAKRILHSLLDEAAPGVERARTGNGAGNSSMYRLIAENLTKGDIHDTLLDEQRVTPTTPLSEERVTSEVKRVTSRVKKGDTHVTRSVIEPSITTTIATQPALIAPDTPTAAPEPPPRAKKHRESGRKEASPATQEILAGYAELKGIEISYGKEGVWAKKLGEAGGTRETVAGCYKWLKAQAYWQNIPVTLAIVYQNWPEYNAYVEKKGKPQPKPSVITIYNQYTGQYEERRLS